MSVERDEFFLISKGGSHSFKKIVFKLMCLGQN